MKKTILILLLIAFTSFVACKVISKEEAVEAFLKKNPGYTILYAAPGEGDESNVYYHFEYKKPNDDKVYKEIWLFMKEENGTWKSGHK